VLGAWNVSSGVDELETNLASQRKGQLVEQLTRKRNYSIGLAFVFFVLAIPLWFADLAVVSFCGMVLGAIFLVRYFDANSHRHEVLRRSDTALVPNTSLLRGQPGHSTSDSTVSVPSTDPRASSSGG
jgi:hypothetical protein